jgi:hypothetical protein
MNDKTIKMVPPRIGDLVRFYDAKDVLWQGVVVDFEGEKNLLVAVPAIASLIYVPAGLAGVVEENWWARAAA